MITKRPPLGAAFLWLGFLVQYWVMLKYKKGNADVLFFVGFFVVLFILWWAGGGPNKTDGKSKSLFSIPKSYTPATISSGSKSSDKPAEQAKSNTAGEPISPYQGKVKISSLGTAKSQYDPDFEYIILRADGNKEPINITGWILMNGRNRNPAAVDIAKEKGVINQVNLPVGRLVYLIGGLDNFQSISLSDGQEAVVTTGYAQNFGSYRSSFKTNICLGYLEDEDEKFYPSLKTKCPDPEIEPGIEFVNDKCRDFIVDLNTCHSPSTSEMSDLSSSCRDYVREHYNYRGCVNNHINDKNFYGNQWLVYLNRPWEMWAKSGEVITLLDDKGLIVDRKSY